MSYTIETIAERISARRVGDTPANIDWLLTDSRRNLIFCLNYQAQ